MEDTAFFRYGRLLSRNDVGFNPGSHFLTVQGFNTRVSVRPRDFPHGMLMTATHDHKRDEDTRPRLTALSAHARQWRDISLRRPPARSPGRRRHVYIVSDLGGRLAAGA